MIFYRSCSGDSGNELEMIKHLRKARTHPLGRWRYERDKTSTAKNPSPGIRHPWPRDDGVPGEIGKKLSQERAQIRGAREKSEGRWTTGFR